MIFQNTLLSSSDHQGSPKVRRGPLRSVSMKGFISNNSLGQHFFENFQKVAMLEIQNQKSLSLMAH